MSRTDMARQGVVAVTSLFVTPDLDIVQSDLKECLDPGPELPEIDTAVVAVLRVLARF